MHTWQAELHRLDRENPLHTTFPQRTRLALEAQCRHIFEANFSATYTHLRPHNAHRHVILPVGSASVLDWCTLADFGFAAPPVALSLLQRMPWLMHEIFDPWEQVEDLTEGRTHGSWGIHSRSPLGAFGYVRGTNVPFPACVHTQAALRRMHASPRPYLMSYGGSLEGSETAMRVRRMLWGACLLYGEPTCKGVTSGAGAAFTNDQLMEAYTLKRTSIFCLEPPGFANIRKAILDALQLGCIPVLFLPSDITSMLWPWHWGDWRNESSVILPLDEYTDGRIDLRERLSAITAARVASMQASIARHATRLVYHLDEDYSGEDALDILLSRLAFDEDPSWTQALDFG